MDCRVKPGNDELNGAIQSHCWYPIPTCRLSAPPAPAPPPPAPAASNNQDDIDALLSGLDEATSPEEIRPPQPEAEVFELTDEMAVPSVAPPQPSFQRVEPQDDIEFTESAASRAATQELLKIDPTRHSQLPAPPSPLGLF